ncbi:hypothetical protein [Sphingomonas hengshuiensis]|uniref:Uncharacterized protein n=1 Tax=Sphingomonas hengshuiensis TaxID=1609977 RepID=A0A7U4JA43_9SPHN|nr:hypothetical protein [Sphingomonas hengshuiensis]AJP72952.1 hypothetical protein TS85_15865 [Sphingomonas hengshuiensis]
MNPGLITRRQKLQAAYDYVVEQQRADTPADAIIAHLVAAHGARHRPNWETNRLTVAGVTSTCTSDAGVQLLRNWARNASLRLIMANYQ